MNVRQMRNRGRAVGILLSILLVSSLFVSVAAVQAAPQARVEIQSATLLNNFQVQVTGTITCAVPGSYFVSVSVRQTGPGQTVNSGFGGVSQTCSSNNTTSWIVLVDGGPFSPGKALVVADGSTCDVTGCSTDTDTREMRLKRA